MKMRKKRVSKLVSAGIQRLVNIHIFMDVLVLLHGKAKAVRVGVVLVAV